MMHGLHQLIPLQGSSLVASCCGLMYSGSWELAFPCLLLSVDLPQQSTGTPFLPLSVLSGLAWSHAAFLASVPAKCIIPQSGVLENFLAVQSICHL